MGTREERFEALAHQVIEPVRRFLARRTDATTAEEVLAETLVVCWRRLDDAPDEPLPWVYGVARLTLANAVRARGRRRRLEARLAAEPGPTPDPDLDPDGALQAALDALPDDQSELLRLWAWERLEPREIAVVLGISANAVSQRLRRAQDRLGDLLREARHDPGAAGHEQGERRRT